MKKLASFKSLREDFKIEDILDAFFGALLFATILFLPVYLIAFEMIIVYMYRLTLLVVLIIIALFGYIALLHYFWKKSLTLKNKEIKTDINKLFLKNTLIINAVILVLGLIFIFVLIPALWV
ncbi:MAG: hypothetical protein JEZ05_04640 [Tenericutes bacterium]|nr:hypothetical protein [Mycoplasmatota bacterium]